MDYILQRTIDALDGGEQFNFKPGRTSGIKMVITGTADTGQTGDLDDLGSLIVTRNERQIANISMRQLANMLDINDGSNLFSSVQAGDFLASITLDFYLRNDPTMRNALKIAGQSELNFEYVPASTVGTVFTALQMKVYAEKSASNEKYELRTLRDNQNEDAAVASKSYQLNKDNIANIYLEDINDVVDLVQLEQSERTVLSPVDWDLLETITANDNSIEDGATDMVKVPCYTPNNPRSVVNYDSILYITTSGSGTIDIVTQSVKIWEQPR